jgi:hypothetical protein
MGQSVNRGDLHAQLRFRAMPFLSGFHGVGRAIDDSFVQDCDKPARSISAHFSTIQD